MLLMRVKLYVFNIVIRSARSVLRHIRCPLHPASWLFLYCQLSRIWCLSKYWINFGATAAVHIHAPVRVNHSFPNFQCILNLRIQVKPRCLLTISLVYEVDKRILCRKDEGSVCAWGKLAWEEISTGTWKTTTYWPKEQRVQREKQQEVQLNHRFVATLLAV